MTRQEYTTCMVPWMKGAGPKEKRRMRMCIGAKICSGKANTEEDAKVICLQPRPEKAVKGRRGKKPVSCEKEVLRLATCVADHADMDLMGNINSLQIGVANALQECMCGRKSEPLSKEA